MPGSFQIAGGGVPNSLGMPAVRSFRDGTSPIFELPYTIRGVTKDSTGAPLASCPVVIYRVVDDGIAGQQTSDASGAYRIAASPALTHYIRATNPDGSLVGTTVNTLVGSPD